MPKTEPSPEAPADFTPSQEANFTCAQEEAVFLEEAISETSQQATLFHPEMAVSTPSQDSLLQSNQIGGESYVSEQSQGVPAVSDRLQEGSVISHQPQALSVVPNKPPSLADTADDPSHAKFTFKRVPGQPVPTKPAATSAIRAQIHPAPQSCSLMVRSVPPHSKAAPASSRLVPSTSEAAPISARSASKPDPVPSVGQAPEPVVPASASTASPSPLTSPTPVKASTPPRKAEPAPQKAAGSSGKAPAAPGKACSEKVASSAEEATVRPPSGLKLAASIPDTLEPTSPVLGLVDPEVLSFTKTSAASGSQTPVASAVARASTVAGSQRSAQVPSRPVDPSPVPKAAPPLTPMGPSEPLETPSAPMAPPASQAAGILPEPVQGPKAAPTAPLEVPSITKAAPSALPLGPSMQKARPAVPEAAAAAATAASAATPAVKSEDPMRWTQDLGRVLTRLSPADTSTANKLPSHFTSVGFSVNNSLRMRKSHNRVNSQSGVALLKNKKGNSNMLGVVICVLTLCCSQEAPLACCACCFACPCVMCSNGAVLCCMQCSSSRFHISHVTCLSIRQLMPTFVPRLIEATLQNGHILQILLSCTP